MRRPLVVSALAVALLLLAASPASAGLGPVTYTFDPLFGPPGTVVSVSAAPGECTPGGNVGFWDSTTGVPVMVGSTTAAGDGSFAGTITIPLDATPGTFRQIGAQCEGMPTQYVFFEVTGAPGTTSGTAPATTGSTAAAPASLTPAFTG